MEYFMEFHGTLVPPNEISLSCMEFHGTLSLLFYSIPCYHALPWDIPRNSMELWGRQITKSPRSMGFHGIRRAPFQMTQVFHGIPWNILWNSMELWPPNEISLSSMEFHRTLRLSFHSIPCYPELPWNFPWNSMELWSRQITNHWVPWDFMELGGRHFKWHKCSMKLVAPKFNGIPWN